jgi:hypothetical protein
MHIDSPAILWQPPRSKFSATKYPSPSHRPQVKLVVLSHLSYHIQTSAATPQIRSKLLAQIKQHLIKTCASGQVAVSPQTAETPLNFGLILAQVVATTAMAVKIMDDDGQPANFSTGTKALLMPALGSTLSSPTLTSPK